MLPLAADALLARIKKNYDSEIEAYKPEFVTEVIYALNQDAHPETSPYGGHLLMNDRYLPLLGVIPAWRFTALEPETIKRIGVKSIQWLEMDEFKDRAKMNDAMYSTWLDHNIPRRAAETYTDEAFQQMFDKGWIRRSMQFPPESAKSNRINDELDSITKEEFLFQIGQSTRHIARHLAMDAKDVEGLGKFHIDNRTHTGLRYTGSGILNNEYFVREMCLREEEALKAGNGTRPLYEFFDSMRGSLWDSQVNHHNYRELDTMMSLRGRDYAMLGEARKVTGAKVRNDSHPELGFDIDGLASKGRNNVAVPELMLTASNRLMGQIGTRLKDAPHYPYDFEDLQRMDFSQSMPALDMLREGVKAIVTLPVAERTVETLPEESRKTLRRLQKQAKEINPHFDLTLAEFLNRMERITYNLKPWQLATLQLEQELQPQFWDRHVNSIAEPPINAKTPEEAVAALTKLADTKVVSETLEHSHKVAEKKRFEVLAKPKYASVLSLIDGNHIIDILSIEQLEAAMKEPKITDEFINVILEEKEIPRHAEKRMTEEQEALGMEVKHYARDLADLQKELKKIVDVREAGRIALANAFEGAEITQPDPSAKSEATRDFYRISVGGEARLIDLYNFAYDAAKMNKEWEAKMLIEGSPPSILIHKDMVHHIKFPDLMKQVKAMAGQAEQATTRNVQLG